MRYQCKENDNAIQIDLCDGKIDEFIFWDALGEGVVIGAKDLNAALKEKGFELKGEI